MVTELFYSAIIAQNGQAANPLIREFDRVLYRVSGFKELARAYYFEVVLSPYRCPGCEGRLQMAGPSRCVCACGKFFDPTLLSSRVLAAGQIGSKDLSLFLCSMP